MPHAAKILADSISPDGVRLTTFEITFPRIILAEFNTHRVFSRNSASSRAIPVEKMLKMVEEDPYIPTHWGKNQKGMQAEQELTEAEQSFAVVDWLKGRDHAVERADSLRSLGVHKQITNRLLEPFLWHTVIVTATEWSNWEHLRNNKMAHPEIHKIASMMQGLYEAGTPREITYLGWHLPLTTTDDSVYHVSDQRKISVGRCARVSYLTHEGKRDPDADIALADSLLKNGHMSPFEHVARPMTWAEVKDYATGEYLEECRMLRQEPSPSRAFLGNFRGWCQYRKTVPNEHDILGAH